MNKEFPSIPAKYFLALIALGMFLLFRRSPLDRI